MQYIFVLLALVIFLAIIGWPIWLIIWALIQKKKTGKFPWKKLLIAVIVIIIGIFLLGAIFSQILKGVSKNFGVDSVKEINIPSNEKPSSGSIENLRLPDVRK
ncbi:hypothetical protein HZB96_00890 [Candidatus Gottesmanbacteria bacterium]|nr:hypothetical protein [Candidatus Gottesmanbacteria bacterium]MBI5452227.1 hypothetical protein [Candidatus Gottesmanbacteria bacterium]